MRFLFGLLAVVLAVVVTIHYDLEMVPAFLIGLGLGFISQQIAWLFE